MANIELWAIDLSWDIVTRFYPSFILSSGGASLPKEFADDVIKIALDETNHFSLLSERLKQLGSYFGEHPVHNGRSVVRKYTERVAYCHNSLSVFQ